MDNSQIADVFEQTADLLEFQGANMFRVRAYRNAGRAMRTLTEPVEQILADPERPLRRIRGIGKDLAEKIATLVRSGSLPLREELLSQIPQTVLDLLRVPGLGPKRAGRLYTELMITSLDELQEACLQERVRKLKGFGAKTETAILKGLEIAAAANHRFYWAKAEPIVQRLLSHMRTAKAVDRIEVAGSYRRAKDTVGDLDLLVVAARAEEVMDHFAAFSDVDEVLLRGDTKMSVRLAQAVQVDLRVVPERSFGAALQYFTGSKEHNVLLRARAKTLGLKVNEYGVFRDEEQIAGPTEEDVYAALDLPCFPPELREGRGEFDLADAGRLPELLRDEDLQGDLHIHTTWTDGLASIEEMAKAARWMGHQYLAITDHSKRVTLVHGLDAATLRQQWAEIDRLNARLEGFMILKGVEVDILERGGLDLDDDVLAEADWVLASIHYGQNQPRQQITERVIGALENPHVCAIAHPTGRLLNHRNAYEIDLDAVLKTARDQGKMMELNCNPSRLDMDDLACATAKDYGVPIVLSTDAHHVNALGMLRFGVQQARRGGLSREDVVNTRPWAEIARLLGRST